MANEMDGVDLTILHDTIELKLKAQFPQFKIVEFYREEEERRAPKKELLPALLLDLTEFELDSENDAGSEQLPLIARFEARIIDTFDQDKAKLKIRTLATQLAYYMFKNKRFHALNNVAVGPVSIDAVTQDDFFPELDRFEVWRIDFSMQILIGDNIWKQTGEVPTSVYSHSPHIGFGHEDDYKEIV
ncbi:hypothetical protein [Acinetobacter ursingii]|uniref:hypothetical protein n=1 Tax=Acinetobacter ursingii TaxID=108980 RepID=UPI000F71D146|nr:hypothetical protein [Acinetobacter ursingii]BBF76058.1 hypothetical protein URS_0002 [Acinetobacter ursingii]